MADIQPQVLQYLTKNANKTVFLTDIESDLGLTHRQVVNAVYNLFVKGLYNMNRANGTVIYRGVVGENTYVTMNSKAKVIALLKDGRVLVQIEDRLYVAAELEV